jgi:hypothetical protein
VVGVLSSVVSESMAEEFLVLAGSASECQGELE